MSSGSFTSAGIDSKRQRALPVPRANVDMKTFTPDSSIASDVIPSANFGDRNKGRLADMILLHYTGMPDVEGAIAQLWTPPANPQNPAGGQQPASQQSGGGDPNDIN